MKTELNIESWNRKEHFKFFSNFDEPFFGLTVNIDVADAIANAKKKEVGFFQYYLFLALKSANKIEPFRFRITDNKVFIFDHVDASPTINRPDGTFGFGYIPFSDDEQQFFKSADEVIAKVRSSNDLLPAVSGENVIHFSALPWLTFTSLSHARSFTFPDSCPKISFGKIFNEDEKVFMPMSIHVHHALMDGYHVGQFVDEFQRLLNQQ